MDAVKNVGRGWLVALIAFLMIPAAYIELAPLLRDWARPPVTSETDLRAEVEKELAGFKTYQVLKEYYPEAYAQLLELVFRDMREGTDPQRALIEGAEFTANLRRQNAPYFAMASLQRLRLSLSAQIPQYDYVRTGYGFKVCNELVAKGGVALTRTLGPDFLKDQTLMQLSDETTGYYFRTAAEGKSLKLKHLQPTVADWRITVGYLKSKGMTDADLQLIIEPGKHLDDKRMCDVAIKFYQTITTMDNDAAQRIVPYLASVAAAG
ncbi:hypothetical protein [Taklimakanibacter lacteus]|uniref:hypothetical protein n=1 Tax=Taklimakanibacter lacteus TaxID=2268456 RepID=UPI0013C528C5